MWTFRSYRRMICEARANESSHTNAENYYLEILLIFLLFINKFLLKIKMDIKIRRYGSDETHMDGGYGAGEFTAG